MEWSAASDPLIGITPMMDFFREHYGKTYAPNTRETVRRYTVHQFVQAGLVLANPDCPSRPTNSPKAVYQIEPSALALLRALHCEEWDEAGAYLSVVEPLRHRYARERDMNMLPVALPSGQTVHLSPGGQNVLVKRIVEEFCRTVHARPRLIYVGDTRRKWAYYDAEALGSLGIAVEEHGKMPDVVVHDETRIGSCSLRPSPAMAPSAPSDA